MHAHRLLIAGRLEAGAMEMPVVDPATGEAFATAPRADRAQVERAIDAASAAFPGWAALPPGERTQCLDRFADAIEGEWDDLAALLTREQGKPLVHARLEIGNAIAALRYYRDHGLEEVVLRDTAAGTILQQHVPLGVVAAITPWNFPVSLLMTKIAPALAIGNTVVAKPAATTPLSTLALGRLASDIFPAGVLNIITDANDLGDVLTGHPAVAKVSFTGSTATGKRVMAAAADTLKRITLELGGNDPAILLDDVDIGAIAPRLFRGAMFNAGQVCIAVKRIYVPRALLDALGLALGQLAKAAVVGAGSDPASEIGPLQNRAQYERVRGLIDEAAMTGTVLAGGVTDDGRGGFFIAPTIVRDLPDDARLIHEEQFGPVLPLVAYDSLEVLIAQINADPFGLGASVWSADVSRAVRVAQGIHAGTVWVNKHSELLIDVPFGGAKQSGIGRERGLSGLEEFSQTRIVNISRE